MSDLVPRPRPGFESADAAPVRDPNLGLLLFAATLRASMGVLCLGVALLYLPAHMWTPILSGVSILMIVNGTTAVWRVGRDHVKSRGWTRPLVWAFPGLSLLIVLAALVFGPGVLGPDWRQVAQAAEAQQPARFEPAAR